MNIKQGITRGILPAAALTCITTPATPAQAVTHTTPCPTSWACPAIMTNAGNWAPQIKPASLYLAAGGGPYITALTWQRYDHTGATGHGTLHAATNGTYHTYRVTATFTRTELHGPGENYYSRLRLTDTAPAKAAPETWHVNREGYWVS